MAVDYILQYRCGPKEQLGDGDDGVGTDRLLEALKSRRRADLMVEMAGRDGGSPQGRTITLMTVGPNREPVRTEVAYETLRAESDRLVPFESECARCPANVQGQPFGCIGVVNYPVPRSAEEWLMARLQPETQAGGQLLVRMIRDFSYTGEPIRNFRSGGLFESPEAVRRNLGRGPSGAVVTSDQVFQALFCIEEPLNPAHCLCVLCWLGCLTLDGALVVAPEQLGELVILETPAERLSRASLDVGPASADAGVAALQRLLRALHVAWVQDAPLWVWA